MRLLPRLVTACMLVVVATAHAGSTPDGACLNGRYAAAAKYAACHHKLMGKFFSHAITYYDELLPALAKCRIKYASTWGKLRAKATGSGAFCDNPRLEANGDGTVTDRLTGLQWEQKTDDATVHDADNDYSWSESDGDTTDADGTAFTTLLATLNGGACFAGHCDWRLPTLAELQTIACSTSPCINVCSTEPCFEPDPFFGPTRIGGYWSTMPDPFFPNDAWLGDFFSGVALYQPKYFSLPVRAVRGGL